MGSWRVKHLPEKIEYRGLNGMRAFYINAMLRSLAFALVGIFTPVYIYKIMREVLGGGMKEGLIALVIYYFLVRLTVFVSAIPFSKVIEKIGFRRSVGVSVGLLIGYFLALFGATKFWGLVYVAGLLLGLNIPLYWISRSSVLSIDGDKKEVGKQMGFLSTMDRLGAVLGPISGAFIIDLWGFRGLYLLAFVILLISLVPLLSMPHHKHRNGVSWQGFRHWLVDKRFYHQAIGTVSRTFDDYSATIVWPLIIWLMGIKFDTMGWIFSLMGLVFLFWRLVSGMMFDWLYQKGGWEDEMFFGVSTIVYGLTWIARILITTVKGILIVDGGFGGFGVVYRNVSDDYVILGGKRMHEIAYYTYRTLTYTLGVFLYLGLWLVGIWWGNWRAVLFGATAIMVVMGIFQARESNIGC